MINTARKFRLTLTEHGGESLSQDFDITSKEYRNPATILLDAVIGISDQWVEHTEFHKVEYPREVNPL
jgi:hypothetical protein